MDRTQVEQLMRLAQKEVDKAVDKGDFPFGAVLADFSGNVISKAHCTMRTTKNPTAHAEINLIKKACKKLGTMDLSNYCIIVNAQSCSMCMSACLKAKIKYYFFGAPSKPNMNPNYNVFEIAERAREKLIIEKDILKESCIRQIEDAKIKLNIK